MSASDVRLCIDWTACDGRGLCVALVPELLGRDEWGYPMPRAGVRDAIVSPALPVHAELPLPLARCSPCDCCEQPWLRGIGEKGTLPAGEITAAPTETARVFLSRNGRPDAWAMGSPFEMVRPTDATDGTLTVMRVTTNSLPAYDSGHQGMEVVDPPLPNEIPTEGSQPPESDYSGQRVTLRWKLLRPGMMPRSRCRTSVVYRLWPPGWPDTTSALRWKAPTLTAPGF